MKFPVLRRSALPALLVLSFCISPLALSAQENDGPPKVLSIQREFPKPGKGGALHEKTESVYLQALKSAKSSMRYIALEALSGPTRALFISGYDSLAAMETENKAVYGNAPLASSLDHAMVADGDLLSATDSSVWMLREDLSLKDTGSMVGVRYMRITQYHIKPGRSHEWEELVKMVSGALDKSVPAAHWALFEEVYGTGGNEYIAITSLKSMTEEDARLGGEDKEFASAMGEGGLKKISELSASCIESEQSNLFLFNPKMSYAPDSWVKAEPSFWQPKTEPHTKKAASKAAAPAQ
jgi:hypothetical protein